jgi:hypothetical protein
MAFNFEDVGVPIALLIDTNKKAKDWTTLYLAEDKLLKNVDTPLKEVKLIKESQYFQPIPNKNTERSINYVTGSSGSGKSHWTKNYIEQYHRIYPKRDVYIFSALKDDKTLDKLKYLKRIKLEGDFLTDTIDVSIFKDSMLIFDDTDTIDNKFIRNKVYCILGQVLQTGRHFNISCIYTSHLATDKNNTKLILAETHAVTIFPTGLGGRSIKYLLEQYFGLNRIQIQKIKKLKSRFVTLNKTYPMCVVSEKDAYILNADDDV